MAPNKWTELRLSSCVDWTVNRLHILARVSAKRRNKTRGIFIVSDDFSNMAKVCVRHK